MKLAELRVAIAAGLKSGKGRGADQVFTRLEAKYRAQLGQKV